MKNEERYVSIGGIDSNGNNLNLREFEVEDIVNVYKDVMDAIRYKMAGLQYSMFLKCKEMVNEKNNMELKDVIKMINEIEDIVNKIELFNNTFNEGNEEIRL